MQSAIGNNCERPVRIQRAGDRVDQDLTKVRQDRFNLVFRPEFLQSLLNLTFDLASADCNRLGREHVVRDDPDEKPVFQQCIFDDLRIFRNASLDIYPV